MKSTKYKGVRSGYLILLLTVASVVFAYGVAVGQFRLFPYHQAQQLYKTAETFFRSPREKTIIATNLLPLDLKYFDSGAQLGLRAWGGGLTRFGDILLGTDKWGSFYLYTGTGNVLPLDINLELGTAEFRDFMRSRDDEETTLHRSFRVDDVLARIDGNVATLFVTHTYWNTSDQCVEYRVSRLKSLDIQRVLSRAVDVDAGAWDVIYKSFPCLGFKAYGGFGGIRSGGRMALDRQGDLIVAIGEFEYDGFNSEEMFSQDDSVSYGKIIGIDLDTLEPRAIAKGIRNPQGLYIDDRGNIWETEHGPRGGDEFNLIEPGRNYGWPHVIYGTDYDLYEWPLSEQQGHHEGFERPIYAWTPSIAVSNLIQIGAVPDRWTGDFLVSSLKAESLYRLRVRDGRVILSEPIKIGSRIRDLEQMQDGTIVLWTDQAHFIELHATEIDNPASKTKLTEGEKGYGLEPIVRACKECHSFAPGFGGNDAPPLWNIYNRNVASTDYENYSEALKAIPGSWEKQSLGAFLTNPQDFAPGTSMPDPKLDDPEVVDALVRYLTRLRPIR